MCATIVQIAFNSANKERSFIYAGKLNGGLPIIVLTL